MRCPPVGVPTCLWRCRPPRSYRNAASAAFFIGAVTVIFCAPGHYRFRLYAESLSLCLRERESNQRESAPGIRVSLRETDSLRSPCGPAFGCYSATLRFPRSGAVSRVVTVGHPWPIVPRLASLPNAPLCSTSTRPPDGTGGSRRLQVCGSGLDREAFNRARSVRY